MVACFCPQYCCCGHLTPITTDHQFSLLLATNFLLLTTFLSCLPSLLSLLYQTYRKKSMLHPLHPPMLARPTFASTARLVIINNTIGLSQPHSPVHIGSTVAHRTLFQNTKTANREPVAVFIPVDSAAAKQDDAKALGLLPRIHHCRTQDQRHGAHLRKQLMMISVSLIHRGSAQ